MEAISCEVGVRPSVSCHPYEAFNKPQHSQKLLKSVDLVRWLWTLKKWILRHTSYLRLWLAMGKKGARSTVRVLSSKMTSPCTHWRKGRPASRGGVGLKACRLNTLEKGGNSSIWERLAWVSRATAWCWALLFCSRRCLETLGKDI